MMDKPIWYLCVVGLAIFMIAMIWLFVASFVYENELYEEAACANGIYMDVQAGDIVLENDETISNPQTFSSFTFTVLTDAAEWTGEEAE